MMIDDYDYDVVVDYYWNRTWPSMLCDKW